MSNSELCVLEGWEPQIIEQSTASTSLSRSEKWICEPDVSKAEDVTVVHKSDGSWIGRSVEGSWSEPCGIAREEMAKSTLDSDGRPCVGGVGRVIWRGLLDCGRGLCICVWLRSSEQAASLILQSRGEA